mgnify:CR=1 FL=1
MSRGEILFCLSGRYADLPLQYAIPNLFLKECRSGGVEASPPRPLLGEGALNLFKELEEVRGR